MSNKRDLEYIPIRKGNVYYNEDKIDAVRRQAKGNKSHIKEEKRAYRKFVRKVVFTGLIGLIITISYFNYRGEKDEMNMNKQDQYVNQVGSIMNNYSEDEIIDIANQTIEVIKKKGGDQRHLDYLNECLDRLPYLKSKGMSQEVGMRLRDILAIASNYDIYLAGYDYKMPSFVEYFVDGTIDVATDTIDTVKSIIN